jgi:hypothetical protein
MNLSRAFSPSLRSIQPGIILGLIIVSALLAFEIFNYSTTDFALRDLLGNITFAGIRWATILSIAFCGIDFAGIARIFTPETGSDEPKEVWYLFGAWLLAASMNAILTWWGVSMAIANHTVQSTAVVNPNTITKIVPVFVALMVWVIRLLIIGTLSVAGDRFFSTMRTSPPVDLPVRQPSPIQHTTIPSAIHTPRQSASQAMPRQAAAQRPNAPSHPAARPSLSDLRPEPTYHSLNAAPIQSPPKHSSHRSF